MHLLWTRIEERLFQTCSLILDLKVSLMKPETDILSQKSESLARLTMKVHVVSSFKTKRRWQNDKQKKNEQEMLLCSSVLTTWPLTYHFTWIQLASKCLRSEGTSGPSKLTPGMLQILYMPLRDLNIKPQDLRQAHTVLCSADWLLAITGEQATPWCHQTSAAMGRSCNVPVVPRVFANWIAGKILASNDHLDPGNDQSPKVGLLCHFRSPSTVNSAALTPSTLQRKEVEVHAQKAHNQLCVEGGDGWWGAWGNPC